MAIDMNSMAAGYGGYTGQQQPQSGGMPAAPTPQQGIANMIQALIKGYQGNKYVNGQSGTQPLTNQNGMGIPTDNTSQAAMGGGAGGGVYSPTGVPAPQQTAAMTPEPVPQSPYSDQTIGGLFGGNSLQGMFDNLW